MLSANARCGFYSGKHTGPRSLHGLHLGTAEKAQWHNTISFNRVGMQCCIHIYCHAKTPPVREDKASALKLNSVLPITATMTAIVTTTAPTWSSSGTAIYKARPVAPMSGSKDLQYAPRLRHHDLKQLCSWTDQGTCVTRCMPCVTAGH